MDSEAHVEVPQPQHNLSVNNSTLADVHQRVTNCTAWLCLLIATDGLPDSQVPAIRYKYSPNVEKFGISTPTNTMYFKQAILATLIATAAIVSATPVSDSAAVCDYCCSTVGTVSPYYGYGCSEGSTAWANW